MPAPYRSVAGVELPVQLAGHPALEFCNTLAGWNGEPRHEYLRSYEHLARWTGSVGLATEEQVERVLGAARTDEAAARRELERALQLRDRLYRVLAQGARGSAIAPVADAVEAAAAQLSFRAGRFEIADRAGLALPVHAVAWSAAQLLTSADAEHVRACPGAGCGWLFVDRRGRRRWCTMAVCGNRAKVRRFADRHREDA